MALKLKTKPQEEWKKKNLMLEEAKPFKRKKNWRRMGRGIDTIFKK